MSDYNLKGWDLMYKLIEHDIKKLGDLFVALVHLTLINCDFKCVGLGDSEEDPCEERPSEILPANWNADNSSYSIRYVKNNDRFNFNAFISEDEIVINLLDIKDVSVTTMNINVAETVLALKGDSIESIIPTYKDVVKHIKLSIAKHSTNKEATTQTCSQSTSATRAQGPPRQPHQPSARVEPVISFRNRDHGRVNPFDYGRADLDPFAMGGGGMLYDPMNQRPPAIHPGLGIPGHLPRGARPPGSRFDPMGPPDVERRPRPRLPPGADEMPPPGYEDMFM